MGKWWEAIDRHFVRTMAMNAAAAALLAVMLYLLFTRPGWRHTWEAKCFATLMLGVAYLVCRNACSFAGVRSFAELVSYGVDLFRGGRRGGGEGDVDE